MPSASPQASAAVDASQARLALVLADSHAKCGEILHWIATEHGGEVRRLHIPGIKSSQDFEVRSVEVAVGGGRRVQVVGLLSMALQQEALAPLLRNVERIVAAVYTPQKSGAAYAVADALSGMSGHFARRPQVSWAMAGGDSAGISEAVKRLSKESFAVDLSVADAGNFAAIWRSLRLFGLEDAGKDAAGPGATAAGSKDVQTSKGKAMASASESLSTLMQIDGALGGLIADYQSGMVLAKAGGGVNLDVAAAGNSEVIKSKMKTMQALGLKENIDDILITLSSQYHVIRPVAGKPGIFLYLVLDKAKANLAMARFKVTDVEKAMKL